MSRIIRVPKYLLLLVVSLLISVVIRAAGLAFGHAKESRAASGKQITLLVKKPRLRLFNRSTAPKRGPSCYKVQLANLQPFLRITPIATTMATLPLATSSGMHAPGLAEDNFDAMIMTMNEPALFQCGTSCGCACGCTSGDCGHDGGGDLGCAN